MARNPTASRVSTPTQIAAVNSMARDRCVEAVARARRFDSSVSLPIAQQTLHLGPRRTSIHFIRRRGVRWKDDVDGQKVQQETTPRTLGNHHVKTRDTPRAAGRGSSLGRAVVGSDGAINSHEMPVTPHVDLLGVDFSKRRRAVWRFLKMGPRRSGSIPTKITAVAVESHGEGVAVPPHDGSNEETVSRLRVMEQELAGMRKLNDDGEHRGRRRKSGEHHESEDTVRMTPGERLRAAANGETSSILQRVGSFSEGYVTARDSFTHRRCSSMNRAGTSDRSKLTGMQHEFLASRRPPSSSSSSSVLSSRESSVARESYSLPPTRTGSSIRKGLSGLFALDMIKPGSTKTMRKGERQARAVVLKQAHRIETERKRQYAMHKFETQKLAKHRAAVTTSHSFESKSPIRARSHSLATRSLKTSLLEGREVQRMQAHIKEQHRKFAAMTVDERDALVMTLSLRKAENEDWPELVDARSFFIDRHDGPPARGGSATARRERRAYEVGAEEEEEDAAFAMRFGGVQPFS